MSISPKVNTQEISCISSQTLVLISGSAVFHGNIRDGSSSHHSPHKGLAWALRTHTTPVPPAKLPGGQHDRHLSDDKHSSRSHQRLRGIQDLNPNGSDSQAMFLCSHCILSNISGPSSRGFKCFSFKINNLHVPAFPAISCPNNSMAYMSRIISGFARHSFSPVSAPHVLVVPLAPRLTYTPGSQPDPGFTPSPRDTPTSRLRQLIKKEPKPQRAEHSVPPRRKLPLV